MSESRKNKLLIYLSFPITGLTEEETHLLMFKIYLIKEKYDNIIFVDTLKNGMPQERSITNVCHIVRDGRCLIERADLMIVLYMKPSVGQSMEILLMYQLKKPVIVFLPKTLYDKDELHGVSEWLYYHVKSIYKFDNMDDVLSTMDNTIQLL